MNVVVTCGGAGVSAWLFVGLYRRTHRQSVRRIEQAPSVGLVRRGRACRQFVSYFSLLSIVIPLGGIDDRHDEHQCRLNHARSLHRRRRLTMPVVTPSRPRPCNPLHQSSQSRCSSRRLRLTSPAVEQDSGLAAQPLRCKYSVCQTERPS